MSFKKVLSLSTGTTIPQIGLGTWQSAPGEVTAAVEAAVRNNYRHLDLAAIYENQTEVGEALSKVIPSVVKREELFITSKLWNSSHKPSEVEKELDQTLKDIGTDYLDLYLIHWPVAFVPGRGYYPEDPKKPGWIELDLETSLVETWKALIALPKSKVRAIGVSNFNVETIKALIKATGVKPAVNQIEAHPYLPQDDLVKYLNEEGIHITAYSPLGNNSIGKPKLTDVPQVKEIAKRLGATEAQVLVAWGVKRGYSVIPKSVQEGRIISNFKQVELSDEDYEEITAFGKENYTRFNIPFRYKPSWSISIFDEPEEKEAEHAIKIE